MTRIQEYGTYNSNNTDRNMPISRVVLFFPDGVLPDRRNKGRHDYRNGVESGTLGGTINARYRHNSMVKLSLVSGGCLQT